ncbi:hypothetical protein BOSEA31B_12358 [Hyphomicrobiales bacterium]|nr:hypothetical protein BOSEA31B_12358 [Hyphomicrobiales bacterium]CAH1698137.1 hypothetical protein BOSEA1005_11182 [Hyphomicrobiales bacterium]CAI0347780.1 hypothetical protein BO1005MUT1_90141 [Hyphomicrobiales bacterium]
MKLNIKSLDSLNNIIIFNVAYNVVLTPFYVQLHKIYFIDAQLVENRRETADLCGYRIRSRHGRPHGGGCIFV